MKSRNNPRPTISVYKSPAPPFPIALMASCYTLPMTKSVGVRDYYSTLFDFMDNKVGNWHFYQHDIDRITPKVLNALLKDNRIVKHCAQQYVKYISRVTALLDKRTLQERLRKMSVGERVSCFKKAMAAYQQASYYVEPPDFSLELGGYAIVKERIKQELESRGIIIGQAEFEAYIGTLFNFTALSFVQRSELAILKAARLSLPRRKGAIKKIESDFYWRTYDYYGELFDTDKIEKEIQTYQSLPAAELARRIKEIEKSPANNEKTLTAKLQAYPLSKELRNITKIIREFSFLYSDIKKGLTSKANVGFGIFLAFLSEQTGVDEYLLHYATPAELIAILEGKISAGSLNLKSRLSGCVYVNKPKMKDYFELLDKSESKRILSVLNSPKEQDFQQLKGLTANLGKYIGPAKVVINVSQIGKVAPGDVLVAPMTAVGFVPAMKKVKAIITDIGGITSHAAIVSRELGIPCIVGLKSATQSIHDDDIVEVDANHGIVNLISKNQ